ncbi:MAG: glycosyltransferase family 39 protein [Deltaproteobacteria bacterium]|nr:glycosyltransferase family 39 protein [Deltaproteobacteria bacterium]MBW1987714.1 glycosyltransferase family 39 protein [Deltaproteobacteria bacterium]
MINQRHSASQIKALVLLLGLAAGLFFFRLGVPGLMDPDEGRYAEIAREMWVRSDWITPHLNQVKYLEKPPLVYWLTSVSLAVLGKTETAARLVPALSAIGGILAVYGLGRVMFNPTTALMAAAVLLTSVGYVIMGRILTLDMTLTCFLTLGIGLGYLAITRERRAYLPWAYLSLALALLTKGLVALVLPGLIFGAWAVARRDFKMLLRLWDSRGFLILLLVGLPWFVLVTLYNPEFPGYFLFQEHWQRYLTSYSHHEEPVYYFVGIVALGLLPWSFLLPWALGQRRVNQTPVEQQDNLFLLLWMGVILIFFSVSRAKLAPYILPALPPLALQLGRALSLSNQGHRPGLNSRGLSWSLLIWLLVGLGMIIVFLLPPASWGQRISQISYLSPYSLIALLVLAAIPGLALAFRRRPQARRLILVVGAVILNTLVIMGIERVADLRSGRALAQVVNSEWQPGEALVGYRVYLQSLEFYTGQDLFVYQLKSELDFGRRHTPGVNLFLDRPEALEQVVQQRSRVYLLLKNEDWQAVQHLFPGRWQILTTWRKGLLVSIR